MRGRMNLGVGKRVVGWVMVGITGLAIAVPFVADAAFSPVSANQRLSCRGSMNNGWRYTAEFSNGRFTQIRWRRSGQSSTVSTLTYSSTNAQGQPVYTGAFRANTAVTLVDLSRGYVRPGSQISVSVEEWGWSRGNCHSPIPGAW